MSSTYYLDSMGRPKDGATHRAIHRDQLAGRARIHRRADAIARGVPYGTPVAEDVAPVSRPAPPPPLHPSLRPSAAPPEATNPRMNATASAPAAPSWAGATEATPETTPATPDALPEVAPVSDGPELVDTPPEPPKDDKPELTPQQQAALEAQQRMIFGLAAEMYGGALARLAVMGTGEAPRALRGDERDALSGAIQAVAEYYLPAVEVGPAAGLFLVTAMLGHAMRLEAVAAAKAKMVEEGALAS